MDQYLISGKLLQRHVMADSMDFRRLGSGVPAGSSVLLFLGGRDNGVRRVVVETPICSARLGLEDARDSAPRRRRRVAEFRAP